MFIFYYKVVHIYIHKHCVLIGVENHVSWDGCYENYIKQELENVSVVNLKT